MDERMQERINQIKKVLVDATPNKQPCRIDRQVRECLDKLMTEEESTSRVQLIETLEQGLKVLGLLPIVSAYLGASFGVGSLRELDGADLRQALRFVTRLEQLPPVDRPMPIPAGTEADGELLWFRGRMTWGEK